MTRTKRYSSWLALGLLASALTLGCGSQDSSSSGGGGSTSSTSAGGAKPAATAAIAGASNTNDPGTGDIIVGEYGSTSGPESTYGISNHKGVQLAVDEKNAAGGIKGRQIKVVALDDEGKAQTVGTVVTRLINDDKSVALIGEIASSLSIAGGRVAQQYGVPMITPSSTNVKVTQVGDMIFRICFTDDFQSQVCAKFIKDNLKLGKVAVLYDQKQAYSTGLRDYFEKSFKGMGGQIVSDQSYTGGDNNFSAQLTAIRDAKPDAVFLPGYYTDAGAIALQARQLGLTVPLVGADGWDSSQLYTIGGKALDGCYFSNHYAPDEDRPAVKKFVADFKAKYNGETPDSLATCAYDASNILFAAMEKAKTLHGDDLRDAIAATKDFPGVTGSITIDPNRNAKKSAVIVKIQDGKGTMFARVAPE